MLTGGGPAGTTSTFATEVYDAAFKGYDLGDAGALGLLWMVLLTILVVVYVWLSERGEKGVRPMSTIASATHRPVTDIGTDADSPPSSPYQSRIAPWGMWITLTVIIFFGFAPAYWLLVTSLTPESLGLPVSPDAVPQRDSRSSTTRRSSNSEIFGYLRNSIIVSGDHG